MRINSNSINIQSKRFGRLIALEMIERDKNGKQIWNFRCDCGKSKLLLKEAVVGGRIQSCGCLFIEKAKFLGKSHERHGMSRTNFYNIFNSIRSRCTNPKVRNYHRYGARGIQCLWKDFTEFYKDMYASYVRHKKIFGGRNTSIERVNNEGNYCKSNCKWATMKEQQNNRNNNTKK